MSLLLSPIQVGTLHLKNRIVMAPMDMYQARDGSPNAFHLHHYAARALGGTGLIIIEATAVSELGRISSEDLGLWNNTQAEAFKPIVEACHYLGSKVAIQLNHAGRKNGSKEGRCCAPSALGFAGFDEPHALSVAEIERIETEFVDAAKRAQKAGFDAVEIHAAHGYLLCSFLSPLSNQRNDEFGGSFENRMRLLGNVVQRIAAEVQIPIFVRISATEWEVGGWGIDDSVRLGLALQTLGVAMLDVSAGGNAHKPSLAPKPFPLYQAAYAKELKANLSIPVSCVGLITRPSEGEALLLGGVCDLVAFGRELLRNPNLANEAAQVLGDTEKIEPSYVRAYR